MYHRGYRGAFRRIDVVWSEGDGWPGRKGEQGGWSLRGAYDGHGAPAHPQWIASRPGRPDDRVTTLQQAARQASDWEPGVEITSLKSLALLILWSLFVRVTGWGAISNGIAWLSSGPGVPWTAQPAGPLFSLDLWSCAAALFFGLVIANPFAWLNGRRLVFASIAFGMMGPHRFRH